jgi:hypothetical protein
MVVVSKAVLDGLEAVRNSGKINMFDVDMVETLAERMGYSETAEYILDNLSEYVKGVLEGFET